MCTGCIPKEMYEPLDTNHNPRKAQQSKKLVRTVCLCARVCVRVCLCPSTTQAPTTIQARVPITRFHFVARWSLLFYWFPFGSGFACFSIGFLGSWICCHRWPGWPGWLGWLGWLGWPGCLWFLLVFLFLHRSDSIQAPITSQALSTHIASL